MTRPACLGCLVALALASPLFADPPGRDVNNALGVQRAMAAAREHLKAGRPADAVLVLEAELLNADGSAGFLDLLKTAYTARLRHLQDQKADSATIEPVRRRLQALTGAPATGPSAPASPTDLAATVRPPAPPIPDAPTPPTPTGPAASELPATSPRVPASTGPAPGADPFQQPIRAEPVSAGSVRRASEAFAARRYAEATRLFAEAAGRQEPFSPAQRDEWAYSRLHGVAMRLNKGVIPAAELTTLVQEVGEAMKAGSEQVAPFGNKLLAEIRRRNPGAASPAVESGWQAVESTNFRVLHRGQPALAAEVVQTAEAARKDMYDRWAGATAATWAPRCDIYLHPTAADYAKATRKPGDSPGHSTVGLSGGRVASRRIDLRVDEPTLMDAVLPSEVTQVVLADLFADQPLPRWALVGMAALSESPEAVARYRRAVPTLLKDRKLFAVGPFLEQASFPDPASITAFYAESVSLVSFLVELKGPKAFTTFLREAPRRGYARALASHYGFADAAELQDRWQRHVLGGE